MNDAISVVQGGGGAIKNTESLTAYSMLPNGPPPSLPREAKDSVSVKKLLAREGDWGCVKEVLGRIINTKAETVALPERKLQELQALLDIPISQRRMGRNELEQLVGKLRSMHLAVPGAVVHIYHIQPCTGPGGYG